MCNDFDEAVEFASLCGDSISEGIANFMEDFCGVAGCSELANLTGHGSGIDATAVRLPVIPEQGVRLLETVDQDISPVELGDIAASNPLLREKLLSAANSPPFESQVKIVSLKDAVDRLGISEARKVLLAFCAADLFGSGPLQGLWKHSLAVARTASELLAPLVGVNAELA